MSKKPYFQQGDVLLKPIEKIPEGATPVGGSHSKDRSNNVLREGEATGHNHRISHLGKQLVAFTIFMKGAEMYLRNQKPAEIDHEEHGKIILPPGDFFVDGVREKDHIRDETRRVLD